MNDEPSVPISQASETTSRLLGLQAMMVFNRLRIDLGIDEDAARQVLKGAKEDFDAELKARHDRHASGECGCGNHDPGLQAALDAMNDIQAKIDAANAGLEEALDGMVEILDGLDSSDMPPELIALIKALKSTGAEVTVERQRKIPPSPEVAGYTPPTEGEIEEFPGFYL